MIDRARRPRTQNTSTGRRELQTFTLGELSEKLKGRLEGPDDTVVAKVISGVRSITTAGPNDITFLDNPKHLEPAAASRAGGIVVPVGDIPLPGRALIHVEQPYVAFATLLDLFYARQRESIGVSPAAYVAEGAEIGAETNIYPGAYVAREVRIGDRTDVYPGVYVGDGVHIGSDCVLYPNAMIYHGCQIGDRVIIHAGVVIGADGFGFVQQKSASATEPIVHKKVPQLGIVVIEDDVEIGANSAVDRATLEETRVRRGTKIDNLVQIGHNCRVGHHCLLVAHTAVGGSTTLGNYVTVAGQAGISDHLKVGDRAILGPQAGVVKDVPEGASVIGTPATAGGQGRRAFASFPHVPDLRKRLWKLEKRVAELEGESRGK